MRTDKIAVINGLRGCAIAGVVFWHLFGKRIDPTWGVVHVLGIPLSPFSFLTKGSLGVNLFFILSGFVLSLPYLSGRRPLEGPRDIFDFYRRRAARLLPLYFISVAVAMILRGPIDGREFWREAAALATVTFNFSHRYFYPPANDVLWSLGIEVWFSLLFPFLILLVRRIGMPRSLAFILAASFVVRIAGYALDVYVCDVGPFIISKNSLIGNSFLGRCDDFFAGIFLAHLYLKTGTLSRAAAVRLFFGGLTLLTVGFWWLDAIAFWKTVSEFWFVFAPNVMAAGLSLIVFSLLFTGPGVLRLLFTHSLLQRTGMMCYSIYIWHNMLLRPFLARGPLDAPRLLLYLAALAGVSLISYRFIEFAREKNVRRIFRTADA